MDRIWQINGFEGGESDDLVKGPTNSFYSGENIEIRKDLTALQLSPLLEDTGRVFDDNISFMVNLETLGSEAGGIIVCLENGKIFLDGVLKETLNTGTSIHNRIYGIGVNENLSGTQYIYYISGTSFGNGKIHRSTNDLSSFSVNYREYTVAERNPGFVGVINEAGLLYMAIGNKVFLMEQDEIVQEFLVLPSQEEIMGFTQFQGNFKIYTNINITGVQYVWDGVSEAISYRQEWENQPILGVINDGAYDYAILGFNQSYSDLYLISGTQKSELRVNLETANYSRILNGYMSIREGIVYISGGLSGESDNYGIYTYGNYYPGTAKSLVQNISLGNDGFSFHVHNVGVSYFACDDNKVYRLSHNNPPTNYATSGYVVTHIYRGFFWEEKTFNYMKVGFELNLGEIKIYARTDFGGAWKLIKTIDSNYSDKKSLRLDKNELMSNGVLLGTFNELQLKFELIAGASGTPKLYQPYIWMTVTNNK